MSFAGGTFSIAPGTTVRLSGPVSWEFAAGAVVVNDGTVDLGTQATLVESDGFPVTGDGLEIVVHEPTGPLAGVEPGNLGLTMTTAYDAGGLIVERGHQPATATNGVQSIGRWYRITSPQPTSETMLAELRYDLTELNGISPPALSLFQSPDYSGTWVPVLSTGNIGAQTLAGTVVPITSHLTAFDLELALATPSGGEAAGINVWPTLLNGHLSVALPSAVPLSKAELFDASGRRVWFHVPTTTTMGIVSLPIPEQAQGVYLLRINGTSLHRLVQP